MPRSFIITAISSSNVEFTKTAGVPQIPIVFAVPGAITIREKNAPYSLIVGDKE